MKLNLPAKEPHVEECHIEVVNNADAALCDFRTAMLLEWKNASSLYEGAKNLWEEVNHHWTEGKKKVHHGDWTSEDFDRDLMDLLKRQESTWDGLEKGASTIHDKMQGFYNKCEETVEICKHERGEGVHVAWAHLPTVEQAEVRKQYKKHLKPDLDDAKSEYDQLCGYPNGMLTQISLLRKRANEETAHQVELLKKKEGQHHRSPLGLPLGHLHRKADVAPSH